MNEMLRCLKFCVITCMKFSKMNYYYLTAIAVLLIFSISCTKINKFPKRKEAILSETVVNFSAMNSQYDDYNSASPIEGDSYPLVFSSNRNSQGNNYDFIYKLAETYFNVYTGKWIIGEHTRANEDVWAANANINGALNLINTGANELGPFLIPKGKGYYSNGTGYTRFQNYIFMYATDAGGQLDIKFTHNLENNTYVAPQTVSFLNSAQNDAYPFVTSDSSAIYFCSDRDGNFDIYRAELPNSGDLLSRLSSTGNVTITKVPELSSSYDDKCPFIFGNTMVFTSNRSGGKGGYDLYYSTLQNGKWSTPANFGDKINTQHDEYRPIIKDLYFRNIMLLFSSNRTGGKGGFDLYFAGINRF